MTTPEGTIFLATGGTLVVRFYEQKHDWRSYRTKNDRNVTITSTMMVTGTVEYMRADQRELGTLVFSLWYVSYSRFMKMPSVSPFMSVWQIDSFSHHTDS